MGDGETHQAFHALGNTRNSTEDKDLNWPQIWLKSIGYTVTETIVRPFIK